MNKYTIFLRLLLLLSPFTNLEHLFLKDFPGPGPVQVLCKSVLKCLTAKHVFKLKQVKMASATGVTENALREISPIPDAVLIP